MRTRVKDAVVGRRARVATRITLGLATVAILLSVDHMDIATGHSRAWGVVGTIGLGLAILSLPSQTYDLYLRTKRPHRPPRKHP